MNRTSWASQPVVAFHQATDGFASSRPDAFAGTVPTSRRIAVAARSVAPLAPPLLRVLPEKLARRIAPILGRTERGWRKQQSLSNMKLFLGIENGTESSWEQLWNAHMTHLGQTLVEILTWQDLKTDEVMHRISVRGEEHLREAMGPGRGVMVLVNHLGNFTSLAPCACRLGFAGCTSGNALPTPYLDRVLREILRRFGFDLQLLGSGLPAAAAETFRRGLVFSAFVDYSVAGKRDKWFRFGRAETNVSLGPALLALRHRVPVLCATCRRLDAMHHEVTFHPPLPVAESGDWRVDAHELTARALEVVANGIQENPEQWWPWDWAPLRAVAKQQPRETTRISRFEIAGAEVGSADHPATHR